MRRADRLFQIVQYLRGGRLITARTLSQRLEVSERTIYRDIADLQASGVPVDGEAGVGYLMRDGYDLPPLMFTRSEIAALVVGARILQAWGGAKMALSAGDALSKIAAVIPDDARRAADEVRVHAFDRSMSGRQKSDLDRIDAAIENRKVLSLDYVDEEGASTRRDVEPLGLYFWGKVWTLVAWCRLRNGFRMFRIDRIGSLAESEKPFPPVAGRALKDYVAMMTASEGDFCLPPERPVKS